MSAFRIFRPSERDYIRSGFLAKDERRRKKVFGLELNVLQEIECYAGGAGCGEAGYGVAEAGQAEREMMSQFEADCIKKSGLRCEVVTFYAGGLYQLYKYKRYTDVRSGVRAGREGRFLWR